MKTIIRISVFVSCFSSAGAVQVALEKKLGIYAENGVVSAGSAKGRDESIKEVRFGRQKEFERLVFEFRTQEEVPYSEFSLDPKTQRLMVSFFGKKISHEKSPNWKKIEQNSETIVHVRAYPKLKTIDFQTIVFDLKPGTRFEVFKLSAPHRIVLDLRQFSPPEARLIQEEFDNGLATAELERHPAHNVD